MADGPGRNGLLRGSLTGPAAGAEGVKGTFPDTC
eukprot:CAMPEP_0184292072 /NCGR_PEP_ID=MMETSP1049-20130417/3927_1 /TAXON_ID=77928 /ORGANISM="Proteomonas sulcata, Strain CCMP704" /LENGTH=33 /DNA_ID= /DNA_START= /DNA_END= /DNA_ORIENTATION=